ncbi:ATP/GTP-binding protein [Kitasatospora purpeofusca]|uniref:AAA family ATPase n=1 Tax=Kitasatospora purpeofusca TaxID=67352 RepID=UPI0036E6B787
MLLRFRVANVRSLRDEQELNFVVPPDEEPGPAARHITLSDGQTIAVHPLIGIFGANASGKSNVLAALAQMRHAVINSYTAWSSYRGLPRQVFALDDEAQDEPSFFEVDFVLPDGVRWTYGFELGAHRVEAEWLNSYPSGRRRRWLDRDASRPEEFQFPGDRLKDQALLRRTTRPDTLLLTRAAADNHPQLSEIHRWFERNFWLINPEDQRQSRAAFTTKQLEGPRRARIAELLRVADLGIAGVLVDRDQNVRLLHQASDVQAEPRPLDWEHESYGTRSWYALLGPVLLVLDEGAVLLVDEIDASLHPRFAAEIVRLFHDPLANPNDAQLVFTSHDPSILSTPGGGRLLSPGQIWLTEKDRRGATELYPLSAFEPSEGEDLSRSYLTGAFGGVPNLTAGRIARRIISVHSAEQNEREAVDQRGVGQR